MIALSIKMAHSPAHVVSIQVPSVKVYIIITRNLQSITLETMLMPKYNHLFFRI